MSEATGFIPEKFYVTRKLETAENVLGFMQPMHPEGFAARKKSADKWADNGGRRTHATFDPIEVENSALSGFAIMDLARRYTTSNVVWRLIHPMGFEFEITSENFEYLIRNTTIERGVIKDECAFVRANGNVLVPVNSKRFKDTKTQEQYFTKVQKKDFSIGSVVKLQGDDTEYLYYGAYHTLTYDAMTDSVMQSNRATSKKIAASTDMASKRCHFLFDKSRSYAQWTTRTSAPNIIEVVRQEELTQEDAMETLRQEASKGKVKYNHCNIVAFSAKPFKLSSLKSVRYELETIPFDDYRLGECFFEKDGDIFTVQANGHFEYQSANRQNPLAKISVVRVENLPAFGVEEILRRKMVETRNHYYYSSTQYNSEIAQEITFAVPNAWASAYYFTSVPDKEAAADLIKEQLKQHGYSNFFNVVYALK